MDHDVDTCRPRSTIVAEFYDLFVVRRGWTPQQLGEFIANALAAAVLPMR